MLLEVGRKTVAVILLSILIVPSAFAGGSVEVNLPIDQIQGLISQLEQAATNVTGQAGIEVRASIAKLSSELQARLDQINQMGKDWWKMMYGDLSTEINNIETFLKDYLKEVNDMVANHITTINKDLAARIDQINDSITDRLNQVDSIVQRAIAAAQNAAINVITQGQNSILIVLDSFVKSLVRIIVITVLVILFLVIGILAWKDIIPKQAPQIVILSVIFLILLGGSGVLLFSDKALAALFGRQVPIANPAVALNTANQSSSNFITQVSNGADRKTLEASSKVALTNLLAASYVAKTDAERTALEKKMNEITVLLYPPSNPQPGSTTSVALGTTSKYYEKQVTALKSVASQLKVQPEKLYFSPQVMEINKPLLRLN